MRAHCCFVWFLCFVHCFNVCLCVFLLSVCFQNMFFLFSSSWSLSSIVSENSNSQTRRSCLNSPVVKYYTLRLVFYTKIWPNLKARKWQRTALEDGQRMSPDDAEDQISFGVFVSRRQIFVWFVYTYKALYLCVILSRSRLCVFRYCALSGHRCLSCYPPWSKSVNTGKSVFTSAAINWVDIYTEILDVWYPGATAWGFVTRSEVIISPRPNKNRSRLCINSGNDAYYYTRTENFLLPLFV